MTLPIYQPIPAVLHCDYEDTMKDTGSTINNLIDDIAAEMPTRWWELLTDDEWQYQTALGFIVLPQGELWPSGTVVEYV